MYCDSEWIKSSSLCILTPSLLFPPKSPHSWQEPTSKAMVPSSHVEVCSDEAWFFPSSYLNYFETTRPFLSNLCIFQSSDSIRGCFRSACSIFSLCKGSKRHHQPNCWCWPLFRKRIQKGLPTYPVLWLIIPDSLEYVDPFFIIGDRIIVFE